MADIQSRIQRRSAQFYCIAILLDYEVCVDWVDRYGIDIGRANGTVPQPEEEETVTYEDFFYMLDRSLDVIVELIETLHPDTR
ncbi:hypothetical protein CKA32_004022 [Geitlerinema sp. FC II]|nr:hypothetical protein [Geitlerinema sp. CS-897]PPT10109.1 hypothetical protein CKA32_004022 [Geitlerinema sp. FC II]